LQNKINNIYSDIEKKENKDTEYKKFKQHVYRLSVTLYTHIYASYMHAGI